MLVDDLMDPETPGIFRERGSKGVSIRIKANRHLRKPRIAHRMKTGQEEAVRELRYWDKIKSEAGTAEVIQTADMEIENFGDIDDAVDEVARKVEGYLFFPRRGAERE